MRKPKSIEAQNQGGDGRMSGVTTCRYYVSTDAFVNRTPSQIPGRIDALSRTVVNGAHHNMLQGEPSLPARYDCCRFRRMEILGGK